MKGCVWRHPSRWGGLLLWLLLLPLCCTAETAAGERGGELSGLSAEDRINLLCLRSAYPQIRAVESGPDGIWLRLEGERRVLYASAAELAAHPYDDATLLDRERRLARRLDPARMDVSLRASMHLPYLPDPERAATPRGYSPGRWRSYAFLEALYGADAATVRRGLGVTSLQGRKVRMSGAAVRALAAVDGRLREAVRQRPELKPWLVSAGGFLWRPIAGEQRLSPHSFGIAIDLSPQRAPYWRWARMERHPLQQSYDSEIVRAFEAEGFIWGGKWHEYDLMHFEYRPEIMAKARVLHQLETAGGSGLEGLPGGAERDGGTVASPHDLSGVGAAGGSNGCEASVPTAVPGGQRAGAGMMCRRERVGQAEPAKKGGVPVGPLLCHSYGRTA